MLGKISSQAISEPRVKLRLDLLRKLLRGSQLCLGPTALTPLLCPTSVDFWLPALPPVPERQITTKSTRSNCSICKMVSSVPSSVPFQHGIILAKHNNTTITHINAANAKSPFQVVGIPVTMHELSHGFTPSSHDSDSTLPSLSSPPDVSFSGQFGIINFDTTIRLPRHVHISEKHFTTERILVVNGTALVELNKQIYIIPPKTLVTIAPGVPHTWTACPAGLNISEALSMRYGDMSTARTCADGVQPESRPTGPLISSGTFLMVYEYGEITGFFPTEQTETLKTFGDYKRCDDLESIRFPLLSADEVRKNGWLVWGKDVWRVGAGVKELRPSNIEDIEISR
jgi:quercetin dioxygenase-like cupin family protein